MIPNRTGTSFEVLDACFVATDSAEQKLVLRAVLNLVITFLSLLPQRIGCVSIWPDGGVGALLQHCDLPRCGMGNVRLRGVSVSPEYDLS